MPVVRLEVTEGLSRNQKEKIVQQFTQTLQTVAGKKPEHVHITIAEIKDENWGYSGMLTDDFRKMPG